MPTNTSKKKPNYNNVIRKYLKGYTEKRLLDDFYEIFVMIQKAITNFDYETIEEYCSHELYKEYKNSLESLQDHSCKNIMLNFRKINSRIDKILVIDNLLIADVYLEVSLYDYVEDANKSIMYGKKDEKITNKYNLEYILDMSNINNSFVLNNKKQVYN